MIPSLLYNESIRIDFIRMFRHGRVFVNRSLDWMKFEFRFKIFNEVKLIGKLCIAHETGNSCSNSSFYYMRKYIELSNIRFIRITHYTKVSIWYVCNSRSSQTTLCGYKANGKSQSTPQPCIDSALMNSFILYLVYAKLLFRWN